VLKWVRAHSALARQLEARDDPLAQLPSTVDQSRLRGQVVLVGYGSIGQQIANRLREQGIDFVVADEGRDIVEGLRHAHIPAVVGALEDPGTLIQAHIARAGALVITVTDNLLVRQMIDTARQLNAHVKIFVHCANEDEARLLAQDHQVDVFVLDQTLANSITQEVVAWRNHG